MEEGSKYRMSRTEQKEEILLREDVRKEKESNISLHTYDRTLLYTSLEGFMIPTAVISLKDNPQHTHASLSHKHSCPPSLLSVYLSPSRSSRASAVVHSLLRRLPTHTPPTLSTPPLATHPSMRHLIRGKTDSLFPGLEVDLSSAASYK